MKNLLKKIAVFSIVLCMTLSALVGVAYAKDSETIVILYENDVHCVVEGYSKLAAMKNELKQAYEYVGVVSGGDFIQGNSLGVVSRGEYIVKLMNLVGYDAVTLGNHEFDFGIARLEELIGMMDTEPISCNFEKIGENESYFKPYTMVSYGDTKIAYIGITTPATLTSSSPAQFKDENGEFVYTFNQTTLYETVQKNIDAAKAAGADYVIALSHIGYADDSVYGAIEDVEDLIRNTSGFDVVLDAHSHTPIEGMKATDKGGNEVLLTSTGTKFEYIGKLVISDGKFSSELIKTEEYKNTDAAVDAYIKQINDEYSVLGERKVATSEVDLITHDKDGNRLVRKAETNLGDICAEAFRSAVGADIGFINGGGIRSGISKGDVTFNDLLAVFPFNNTVVLAEISGQTLKDMMEMAMMSWPSENGSFPHLSGLTFSVNISIPSSVVLDEQDEFVTVAGQYRVYDMKVFNRESGKYEPIDLNKKYTIASHNYALIDHGSGMKMLENTVVLKNDGILDVEALERHIVEDLGGNVGSEYAEAEVNITFTEGEVTNKEPSPDTGDTSHAAMWIAVAVVAVAVIVFLKRRGGKKAK